MICAPCGTPKVTAKPGPKAVYCCPHCDMSCRVGQTCAKCRAFAMYQGTGPRSR